MSDDRINGMIWGFNVGAGISFAITIHPIFLLQAAVGLGSSIWFACRNASVSGSTEGGNG